MEKLYQPEVKTSDETEVQLEFNSLEFETLKYLARQKNILVENFLIGIIKNKLEVE